MMQKNVFDQIEKIKTVFERWNQTNQIPDVERELVLDKLKNIYEDVMFMQRDFISDSQVIEQAEEESQVAVCPEEAVEYNTLVEEEQVFVEELVAEVNFSGVEESFEHAVAVEEEPPIQEQVLFEHEPTSRAQVDKKVILSLYGEPSMVNVNSGFKNTAGSAVSQKADSQLASPSLAQQKEADAYRANDTIGADVSSHKKVLGEVLTSGNVAFNDMAARQPHMDLASKIHTQSVVDLRQSIGINDKFIMIKDLFAGNTDAYESAITNLNQFTDIDEAMIYIQENYNWAPDSTGVNFLIDLLERKLS